MSREGERTARVRLGEQTPEGITERELLESFLEIKETPRERMKNLLEHADTIFHWEEET
mgnify:CR=1 FL=1